MKSVGPYKAEQWEWQDEFVVTGPGWDKSGSTYRKREAEMGAMFANMAHAAGRKAERERCLRMVYQYTTWEFDGSGGKPSLSVSTVDDIVAAIKGEKDGK